MALDGQGPFRLDTQHDLLLRGSEPVALGRRAFALLRALVERPGAVISSEALISAAWPRRLVEESNLTKQIAALRRVLSEAPGGDRWIETMPRRGYRFVAPVVADADADVDEGVSAARRSPNPHPYYMATANAGRSPPCHVSCWAFRDAVTALLWTICARLSARSTVALRMQRIATTGSLSVVLPMPRSSCSAIPRRTSTRRSTRSARGSNCARRSRAWKLAPVQRCGAASASRRAWRSSVICARAALTPGARLS